MKKIKKLAALLLAMLVIIASLPTVWVFAAEDADMRYGRKMLAQMQHSDELLAVYDLFVDGCEDLEVRISIPDDISLTANEATLVYKLFYADYPQYFWIVFGTPSMITMGGKVIAINPTYAINQQGFGYFENIDEARTQYNDKVAELTSGLGGKSDYEKAMILHDRLCEITTYTSNCNNHQNAYGALVEGNAVCNGYARAYQHLLKTVGIPAWYVGGSSRGIGHAWNTVKIDGEWYYTDTTWDDTDQVSQLFDSVYEYFNITTQQLVTDHTIDSLFAQYVPNATATAANYYVKEDLIFDSFDMNQLAAALARDEENMVQAKVTSDINTFFNSFYQSTDLIADYLGSAQDYTYDYDMLQFEGSSDYIFVVDFDITEVTLSEWEISVNATGVYDIKPSKTLSGFDKGSITVYDKDGSVVKYNDSKKGWPLVASQKYTIKFNEELNYPKDLAWNLTKKADTIFSDTDKSGWYNDAVTYAVGAGIITGYGGTTKFGTADNIQRQDFLVILARLDGVDLDDYKYKSKFPDVERNSYYEAAVNWGVEKGIVNGYDNGKFGVGDKVTREQLVTFLYRYAKYKGYDFSYTNDREAIVSTTYTDYKNVSGFAKDAILWALEKGVISGKNEYTIAPHGNAQRCEVAKIMYNIYLNDIF